MSITYQNMPIAPTIDGVSGEQTPFASWRGRAVTRARFLSHAMQLSSQLPEGRYALNLCEDRYLFSVGFLALLMRNQINLLPPNRASLVIDELLQTYSPSYCLVDGTQANDLTPSFVVNGNFFDDMSTPAPEIPPGQTAVIAFTSGSTGRPKPTPQTWGTLCHVAQLALQQLGWTDTERLIVSTVPAQHMYGLETSLFWPLHARLTMDSRRPFFPEEIRRTLATAPKPCLLVSTPTHLKACADTPMEWDNVAAVLSATSPITLDLAQRIEQRFLAPLHEVFGSTETMSYASRRIVRNERWTTYPGIEICSQGEGCFLRAGHFPEPICLDDVLDVKEDGAFVVAGRLTELVKVAGKRASLTELNHRLNAIDGVQDGIFLAPGVTSATDRLSAAVVTRLSKNKILSELRRSVDEVFLPRPLVIVDEIPRNELGKVVYDRLTRLIRDLQFGDDLSRDVYRAKHTP